jgi:hypothetical protein
MCVIDFFLNYLYSALYPKLFPSKLSPELVFTDNKYFVKSNRLLYRFRRLYISAARIPFFLGIHSMYITNL